MKNIVLKNKPLISRSEARDLLMKNKHHHLWNKRIERWTQEDIDSLKRGEAALNMRKVDTQLKIPVEVTLLNGEVIEFESVADASRSIGICESTLRSALRGRQKTAKGVKIRRINEIKESKKSA